MPADRDDAPLTAMERALVRALISAIVRRGVVRATTATDAQPEIPPRPSPPVVAA